jgi:23S rRNA pseudouridine1911/1915/1917 synthase
MQIPILFEDDNYIIIDKPAGLVVHPDGRTEETTLVDWIGENHPQIKGVGEHLKLTTGKIIDRPGVVHRLDRGTSGAMIIAKNQTAWSDLKAKFQNREVTKKYHAFVYGHLKNDSGVINRPIGRSKKDFRMWSAQRGARGEMREAVTEYRVLDRAQVPSDEGIEKITLVEAEPKTGRTHQIRVHFKALSHPIVGDSLYAPNRAPILGFDRPALHSRYIAFTDITGRRIEVTAPYSEDFEGAIRTLA